MVVAEFGKPTRVCEVDKQRGHFQTQGKQVKKNRPETACLADDHSSGWRATFGRHSRIWGWQKVGSEAGESSWTQG